MRRIAQCYSSTDSPDPAFRDHPIHHEAEAAFDARTPAARVRLARRV
jgi:hypothetical protein